jgi:FAD/FMN-containing dehydrogenase
LPFPDMPAWSVLCEATGGANSDVPNRIMAALESAADAGLIGDALLAQSAAQRDEFWAVRENIPEANRRIGSVSSHDISVPISAIPDFIPAGIRAITEIGDFRINCFGHLGDGNLHYNVFPPAGHDRSEYVGLRGRIKETLHDLVHSYGGSVSAEHGIGRLKTEDLEKYGDPAKLAAMRAIKAALDPVGIMNPGAVLKQD